MEYKQINSKNALQAYVDTLRSEQRTSIALDLEGEFNLHVYGERLCLIQVYDGRDAVIIDPLKIETNALKLLFEDEKLLKVMWDASSDMSLLVNGYDTTIKSVLDLRPAADVLDFPKKDYSSVLQSVLGVETKTKKKFQRYNWLRRPIDPEAIEYAIDDVRHIPALRDELFNRLYAAGQLEDFFHRNLIVQNRNYLRIPGQRHKKMKGYRYLKKPQQELLRRLFDLRDRHARRLDLPPHNVIPNPDLMQLSRRELSPEKLQFARRIREQDRRRIVEELNREIEK
ncbi:MAG: HRDC domain-containing protein [Spirochaetota bacterium]